MLGFLRAKYSQFVSDSLFRNSFFIMGGTAVMSVFGFLFWLVNARLFSPDQIGIATTLISIMMLITNFSLLGFNQALVRFLPRSERKNAKINTAVALVGICSFVLAVGYLVGMSVFSPKLVFVQQNIWYALLFVGAMMVSSLNAITDSVFIAFRKAHLLFIEQVLLSVVKLVVPFVLVGVGAYGIFMSLSVSIAAAFVYTLVVFVWQLGYVPAFVVDRDILREIGRFSLGNYVAGFIAMLPNLLMPVIITNHLGLKESAYFYMATMIINLLFVVPKSVTQSLFAEASFEETKLRELLVQSSKIIVAFLFPGILAIWFLGGLVLSAFGKEYSDGALELLRLLAVSGIFVSMNYLMSALLNVKKQLKLILFMCILGTVLQLGLSLFFLQYDLPGIGYAWLVSQLMISIIYVIVIIRFFKLR